MTGINLIKVILTSSLLFFMAAVYAEKTSDDTQVAGKILLTVGDVYSQRNGKKVPLKRRSKVFEQDEIHVGGGARAQIRMIDSAIISLQENSVLKIKKYRYQKDDKGNSALLELLSGGLRTITGKIGKNNKKAYELRTPLATIGIRGTDYEVEILNKGLYAGVWKGGINMRSLQSNANSITIGSEQKFSFAFMNPEGLIKGLNKVPSVFSNGPSNESAGQGNSTKKKDDNSADQDDQDNSNGTAVTLPDPTVTSNNKTFNAIAINQTNPSGVLTAHADTINSDTPTLVINETVVTPSSSTSSAQSIGGYDLGWGEWSGFTSATNETNTTSNDDLLWTAYDPTSAEVVSAKTGSVNYDHVVDSITTSSQGNVTDLDVNMNVNFDSGTVTDGVLSANTSSDTWVGLFDGQVQNGDLYLQMNDAKVIGPVTDTALVRDASGSINGDFIGDQAQGVIGAFQLSEDGTSQHIEGVFVVEPQ